MKPYLIKENLFGDNDVQIAQGTQAGAAGEHLVLYHLLSMDYAAAIIPGGGRMDIVLYITALIPKRIQVKTSNGYSFGQAKRHPNSQDRDLLSYRGLVDAFAFVHLTTPYPYYFAVEALSNPSMTLSAACFTRSGRDTSFEGLLKRWGQG